MAIKVLIEDNGDFVSFYTSGDPSSTDKDINDKTENGGIRNIYDVRKDVPVVIKTYTHLGTKNFIKICTNDTDSDYPGGSVIKIKPTECALKDTPEESFGEKYILELRKYLLTLFNLK
jgi:hypothetical protein